MTTALVIVTALAIMAGAVAQSVTGVGFGLIAAPALLIFAPDAGPVPVLMASLVVLTVTLIDNRSGWDLRPVATIVAGSAPGVVLGAILSSLLDTTIVSLVVGAVIVVAGAATLCGGRLPDRPVVLAGAGAAAGVLNSLASVPGPALALVYRPPSAEAFRANLSAAFLAMTGLSLVATAVTSPPSHDVLLLGGAVTVLAVIGQLLGRRWARSLPAARVRIGAIGLSIVAGVALIVTAIMSITGPGVT